MKNTTPIKTIGKFIMVTVLMSVIIFGMNTYQKIIDNKNYVEPYCATKHSHNVEDYKACKVLTPTQVLLELKEKNSLEIVDLPSIQ